MNSSASISDRAIAATSLASEVISPVALRDAKAVKKVVEGKSRNSAGDPSCVVERQIGSIGLGGYSGDVNQTREEREEAEAEEEDFLD